MPPPTRFLPLVPVPPEKLAGIRGLPALREFKGKFPKRAVPNKAAARVAIRRWVEAQPAAPAVRNPDIPIKAVSLTGAELKRLRAVAESDVAPAEMLNQKLDPGALFGTLYSALTTYEYMKLRAEYKRRAASPRGRPAVEAQWQKVVQAAQTAFAAAGRPNVTATQLDQFARELTASSANLNTVARLANSAVAVGAGSTLTARTGMSAAFLPDAARIVDLAEIVTTIADLCDDPIAEGSFTKHFSRSISLKVTIKYWCPKWNDPFRTCTKTITLAGVSFSIGVTVGYKVNCCGATAWGQAHAKVCATIVGIEVCAGCTATITGVAGVSRTPVSSGCLYGLGINATLQCKLAGQTLLNASAPFGWTVAGPCPPAGLCP